MRLPKVLRRLKPLVAHQLEMFLLWYYSATAKQRRPKHETGRILLDESFLLGDQSDSKSIAGCNGKGGRFCRDHICGSRKEGFHADDDTGQ